jgi:hypothetical protein
MRVLFLTPVEQGAGETITALHMAQSLVASRHAVRFLASEFAARFLDPSFPRDVERLTPSGPANRALWDQVLARFQPDAVVFADYPLLFFSSGVAPLASEPGWVESLEEVSGCLVTLDHFGFAQREMGIFVGPSHLTFGYQWFPAVPDRFRILLPCPMHEPGPVEGRRGEPFRYWDVPLRLPGLQRAAVRRRYTGPEGGLLVVHLLSNWAWRGSQDYGLSFYRFLPRLLDEYLGPVPVPVTVVSVNNGELLEPPPGSRLSLVNVGTMPADQFQALLLAADLVMTENRVSISLGKAVCGFQTCVVLKNSHRLLDLLAAAEPAVREVVLAMENAQPGAVYPYDVFPTGMVEELKDLVLYRDNSLTAAFAEVEIFGGATTAGQLRGLLTDAGARDLLRSRQQVYVDRLARLEDSTSVLARLVEQERSLR